MNNSVTRRGALGMGMGAVALALGVATSKSAKAEAHENSMPDQAGAEAATAGQIVFYAGTGGTQQIVHTIDDVAGQDFQQERNAKAQSLKLLNVRAGTVIGVYDSSSVGTTVAFCMIEVKRGSPEYTVRSFERSYEDAFVIVSSSRRTGLNGNVARIHVS